MALTYAIADLHGRYDLLRKAYDRIYDHATALGGAGTIVHLGDYVDRGPQSRQVLEFLMDEKTKLPAFKRVILTGNHEQIMLLTCDTPISNEWWISNGGGQTLISYGQKLGEHVDISVVPRAHLKWIMALPRIYMDKHRLFVHAGVNRDVPLEKQDDQVLTWKIYDEWDQGGYHELHVVHGHHQFPEGPICLKDRTDLDTAAWYTGRLVVGVFDDDKAGGPVEFIEVIGSKVR